MRVEIVALPVSFERACETVSCDVVIVQESARIMSLEVNPEPSEVRERWQERAPLCRGVLSIISASNATKLFLLQFKLTLTQDYFLFPSETQELDKLNILSVLCHYSRYLQFECRT